MRNLRGLFVVRRFFNASVSRRSMRASQYARYKTAQRVSGLLILAGLVVSSILLPLSHALPGDSTWKKAGATGITGDYASVSAIASSSDGTRLALAVYYGSIYTSTDSGTTWTERTSAGSRAWRSITSSADGSKLAATVNDNYGNGYIYTSTDSGATWTERTSAGSRYWESITSSADGTKLATVDYRGTYFTGGYIYTSMDSGVTWTEQTAGGSHAWRSITSSADGSKLAAVEMGTYDSSTVAYIGSVYTSTDSGATWTEQTSAGSHSWQSITSSADGSKLAAVVNSGNIYTSTDSGANWTAQTAAGSGGWQSIASSADGSKLAATFNAHNVDGTVNGAIYTSSDSGVTWTERTSAGSRPWYFIASSADGGKLAASASYGSVYNSTDSGATWTEQSVAGLRYWKSITSSADGAKLAAVEYNVFSGSSIQLGSIYTSTDYGTTWTEQTSAGSHTWNYIASSADGTKLAAVETSTFDSSSVSNIGSIYTSTDSGATWTEQTSAGSHGWQSIASSADGSKLAAVVSNGTDDGYIYTSTDSGATWTEQTAAGSRRWSSITSSADGSKLAVVTSYSNGAIYTSTDFGVTWTEQTAAGSHPWQSITSSADGSKLAVFVSFGTIYTSTDSGATWTEQTAAGSRRWSSITSSADGSKLAAAVGYNGFIYNSSDSGANWTEQTAAGSHPWYSIASSADGSKLAAAVGDTSSGSIYLATIEGAATVTHDYGTDLAPSGTDTTAAHATLAVTSSTCYTIAPDSSSVLSPSGLTAPETNVTLLGGIAYSVSCVTQGGSTYATITLGSYYNDVSKLRIYKKSVDSNTLTDVTSQVTVHNTTDSSNDPITTFSYTLVDGGNYDEDGTADGTIVDPVYIGLAGTTSAAPTGTSAGTGALAETGGNSFISLVSGIGLMLLASILLIRHRAA